MQGSASVQPGRWTDDVLQPMDSSAESRRDQGSFEAAQTPVNLEKRCLGGATGAGAALETCMLGRQESHSSAVCNGWRHTAGTNAEDPNTIVPTSSNAEAAQNAEQPGSNDALSSSEEDTRQSSDQVWNEAAHGSSGFLRCSRALPAGQLHQLYS